MSCKYCEPKENGETEELFKRDQEKGKKMWVYLHEDGLNVETDCNYCNSFVAIKISYCPMCGARVAE